MYTRLWDETQPPGTALANTIDTIFQNTKTDLRERVAGIFGMNLAEFTADPIVPKTLSLTAPAAATPLSVIGINAFSRFSRNEAAFTGPLLQFDRSNNIAVYLGMDSSDNFTFQRGADASNAGTINRTTGVWTFPFGITSNVSGNLTGTILTAAQPNITSVGTLTGLTVNGGIYNLGNPVLRVETTGNAPIGGTGAGIEIYKNGIQSFNRTSIAYAPFNLDASQFIFNNGHILIGTDNAYDIGAAGANRPRNLFVAGGGTFGADLNLPGAGLGLANLSTRFLVVANGINPALTFNSSAITMSGTLGVTGAITGNVTGNLTGTILTAAQGNITSLGTLTGLNVTGPNTQFTITSTDTNATLILNSVLANDALIQFKVNSVTKGFVGVSGAAGHGTAGSAIGDAFLTSGSGSVNFSTDNGITRHAFLTGGVFTATTVIANLTGNVTGTILTAAQGNITSLGTLTSLTVSGTLSTADISSSATGATNLTLNRTEAAALRGYIILNRAGGNKNGIGLNASDQLVIFDSTFANSNMVMTDAGAATFRSTVTATGFTGNITGNLTGTILTAAQGNITSLGTLTGLNVNGNITLGTLNSKLIIDGTLVIRNSLDTTTIATFDEGALALDCQNYKVLGTLVVGTRKTGWTAATGTATRTAFATGSVLLPALAEHVKALIDDLISHGLIGA